jgi:chemotaxis protein methyltransferase CheR
VPPPRRAAQADALAPLLDADVDWLDVIRRASERVAGLSSRVAASPTAHAAAPEAPPRDVARALALLREERFGDALEALGPAEDELDPDALVLRAVILASSGDPAAAEAVCARILELDELNAEAHYVLALCREHAGDRAAAANQDHYALYLDPTFAMPRLHLGLLAKRSGDVDGARRELSRALALLAGEDAARVLLLGGGFTRAALAEVCRAELRACGGVA